MNYIYCYTNKINGHKYVGQTSILLSERHRLHISGSKNKNASDYNCLFHQKIREYGIDNFELTILEEVPNKADLDEREIYWIAEKKSYCKFNQGYNMTTGGQRNTNRLYWDVRCKLTLEQAQEIIDKLKNTKLTQSEIAKQYSINETIINQINQGKKYHLLRDEEYPIRQPRNQSPLSEEIVDDIINLLKQGYGNAEIAKLFNNDFSPGTVSSINQGRKHYRANESYPIRKVHNKINEFNQKAILVKDYLINTDLNFQEIANIVGSDRSCVSRINSGLNYHDDNLTYPIRK